MDIIDYYDQDFDERSTLDIEEKVYRWDVEKLNTLYDFTIGMHDDSDKQKVQSHLDFLKVICTGNRVPDAIREDNAPIIKQFEEVVSSLDFNSDLISDKLCYLPMAYSILYHCIEHKTSPCINVFYDLTKMLCLSNCTSSIQLKSFITHLWEKYLDNLIHLPVYLIEQMVEVNQFLIEKYVLQIIKQSAYKNQNLSLEIFTDSLTNLHDLSLLCSKSAYIFQTVTSIVNEVLCSTYSTQLLLFAAELIKLIKDNCISNKTDMVRLYPYVLQPLIGLLLIDPELIVTHSDKTDVDNIRHLIQNEVNLLRDVKEILAIFSHFPMWVSYIKFPICKTRFVS